MKRDPSIHITKSVLLELVKSISITEGAKAFTDEIFRKARAHSIHTRTVVISNDKMEKKAKKLTQSSRYDADLLAKLIYAIRKSLKHRGVSVIKPGGKEWGVVKEITAHALEFCNEFEFTRKEGFTRYIKIGLSKMKIFYLAKFIGLYSGICETHGDIIEIEKDDDKDETRNIYKFYCQRIIENTGVMDELDELPSKYVWFVRARKQAERLNVSCKIYMNAQFEALDFSKGIPYPTQLTGPKATERVARYCRKNDIKIQRS